MKRVKECPACGLYNNRSNDFCDRCGASLDDIIIYVDDSLTEDPEFTKKEEAMKKSISESEQKEQLKEEKEETIICPECGAINPFSNQKCSECGTYLHEEPIEEKKEPEVIKENLSSSISSLELASSYGKEKLVLSEEKKDFGREDFTSPFLKDYLKISRRHFEYYMKDTHVFIIDCSTNGTFLNGTRLIKGIPNEIHNLDKLVLADSSFEVSLC